MSCATRQEAADKYQPDMEKWLEKNGVKYHSISFDKPLAAYYIDDKGMTPESFIEVDIQKLEGGLSGSDIYTDGKLVHKQDKNAHVVHKWFNSVVGINVPKVDRIVGETITMEYIPHDKDFFKQNKFLALGLIQEALESLKQNKVVDQLPFRSYVERIEQHVNASNVQAFKTVLSRLKMLQIEQSFSHGDFGVTNMLFNDNKLFLIDPIPNVFGCTELDAAKFIASLYINKYDQKTIRISFEAMCVYNNIQFDKFKTLVASEIIRVYKYHPDKNFIMDCVQNVFK